jgi:F0F1-type ATP synthase membrane subunit b/b'
MNNSEQVSAPIQITSHGVHFLVAEEISPYLKAKQRVTQAEEEAANIVSEAKKEADGVLSRSREEAEKTLEEAKSQAKELITSATEQKRNIIDQANVEGESIIDLAKQRAFEEKAHSIVTYKAKLDKDHLLNLQKIDTSINDTLNDIVDHLFSNSLKKEFIISQTLQLAKIQMVNNSTRNKIKIKTNHKTVIDIHETIKEKSPELVENIEFEGIDGDEYTVTIDLGDRALKVDANQFLHNLRNGDQEEFNNE